MHLFLLRTPGLDRIWHLHPERTGHGTFEENLPSIDAGHYRVFADIVDKYRNLTRSVITTDRQTAIEKAVLNLDVLEDISELMALLTPTVVSAL